MNNQQNQRYTMRLYHLLFLPIGVAGLLVNFELIAVKTVNLKKQSDATVSRNITKKAKGAIKSLKQKTSPTTNITNHDASSVDAFSKRIQDIDINNMPRDVMGESLDKQNRSPKRIVVDKTLAIMYHAEGSKIILQSDLRPDLTDNTPTLREVIVRELIVLDAAKFKITVSEAELDRHLGRIQESLKKSREELIAFFKERGYSFDEAKKELEKGLLIETTIGERVRRKALVPESEIKKYYAEHPEIKYEVKQAFVPFGFGSKALARASLAQQIESGAITTAVEWSTALTIDAKDISDDKSFIKELAPGGVAQVAESDSGITLLQLVARTQEPFENVKQKIMSHLGMARYEQELNKYYEHLLKNAAIRYLDTLESENAPAKA